MYRMTSFFYFVLLACVSNALSGADKQKGKNTSVKKESFIPKGVTTFGDGLLKNTLKSTRAGENILLSPFNVYSALALTYLGAAGNTQKELQRVLGVFNNEIESTTVHRVLSELVNKLETRAEKSALFTETAFANGLFIQNGFQIKEKYLENAKRYYRTEPTHVDFADNSQMATDTVNEWVSNKTKNRIPKLFDSPVESSTLVLLTCALYFSGKWTDPFPEYKTKRDIFTTENNEIIDVDLMINVKRVPYLKDTSMQYEAIRLPYEKGEYEMIIVLPTGRQTVRNLTESLKYDDYKKLFDDPGVDGLERGVKYRIPRMKFSWEQSLKDTLAEQGVKSLFNKANLTNMVESAELKVSDIVHAAEIEVNEKGTKASAVTGIKFVPYIGPSDPSHPKPFVANKPFLMMIYNRPASTLIFYSCVHKPVSGS